MSIRKLWDYTINMKKEKGISIVERRKKRGTQVHIKTIEKRVYQTLEVASNSTSILC